MGIRQDQRLLSWTYNEGLVWEMQILYVDRRIACESLLEV